ncbi:hypothetical protein PV08_06476 [Exophiala spinifera]|uniref:Uncharacterized protein n=1 Tax=Exophiala spinifera TaxID=91928 RepID=A0A0D2BYN4_9EURO|nr:uncharacterized protein PV08_06476 [Exophiala spinifera]KIW16424.1 hypothetical protein PV08_06476 [Exophiala spinifera]
MRLLTWGSENELVLTDHRNENIPPYAILSHTWGLEHDEVTFGDIQNREGRSKSGYAKILFCGEQARKEKIKHFWVDTCCIDKTTIELSEAITSMFRWYQQATKCYVYLSDVTVPESGKIGNEQSTWELDFRNSRWFTRGWTLQELLAPANVEFFSQEGEFLGTKQTLAHQIHEVTTIPLAALCGTSLDQFPVVEKIRWTEGRETTKREDGAYCLLGIFGVYMSLNYGEGDNAFSRLRRKIDKRHGSNVAARLDAVEKVWSSGPCDSPAPCNNIADLLGRASDSDQRPQTGQPSMLRPAKRARTSYNTNFFGSSDTLPHENTVVSHRASTSSHTQHSEQSSRDVSRIMSEDKYNSLLKSLLFERIDFRVNNVRKALLSTCQWLFHHPHFQTWYEGDSSAQHSGFLWIKGKPGCGKSTLMKVLLEWARKRKSKDRGRQSVVPYFFNARASASLEKSSLGLYRTVVHHLLSSCPKLGILFAEKFAFKDPGQLGEQWSVEELQEFLMDAVESNESFGLCLLIDALDEAEYEDDVRDMIRFLIQLSDRASASDSSCKLRICLSSRHYPHINITKGLSLVVEDQLEHGQDINYYITKELTCNDGDEKDELRVEILNKSAGIFLWVVLVVKILNTLDDRGASLSDMKTCLKTIPANLKELFREILKKGGDEIGKSVLLFQWMLFSLRPLQPAELIVAMQYSEPLDDQHSPLAMDISIPDPERLARSILNHSRGLVEVIQDGPSQTVTVQFIHETVREFLLKENGLASISQALAANVEGTSHQVLRIACHRRISTTDIPKEFEHYCEASHRTNASLDIFKSTMRLKWPFLDYAIAYLLEHAEQAQKRDISQQDFLKSQIGANGLWLDHYRLWWNALERYKTKKVKPNVTLIYFVAERKYSHLLTALLNLSDAINTPCGRYGSALQISSYYGSQEMVKILLDKGADVNTQGGEFGNALQAALENGHEKVVQILLDYSTDANAQGGRYNSPLYTASCRGYTKIVQILLEKGADINAQGGLYSNALQAASACNHEKIVQILLEKGADINAQGGRYGNALQAALVRDHKKIVQILLEKGADINAQGGYYGNALQAALVCDHEKTVQILLEKGADINAQGGLYSNALQAASACNHEKIVQILLEKGADINAQGGRYGNALQAALAASAGGYEKIVQILLEKGANINAQGGLYGNALQAASAGGYEKMVQILLENGADINAQGGRFGNALQAASAGGYEKTVQILLEKGADINAQGGLYGNALQAAEARGHEQVVHLLTGFRTQS